MKTWTGFWLTSARSCLVIVEFTGLPGAGKTTLENAIAAALNARGCKVLRRADVKTSYLRKNFYEGYRRESGLQIPLRLLFYGRLMGGFLRAYRAHGLNLGGIARPGRFFPCLWLYEDAVLFNHFLEEHRDEPWRENVFLPGEGIVHHSACVRVWAGGAYARIGEAWRNKFGGRDIFVFHVHVPAEEALRRLKVRGLPDTWPGPAKRCEAEIMQVLADFEDAIQETLVEFEAVGIRVKQVDGAADCSEQAEQILNFIENLRGAPVE